MAYGKSEIQYVDTETVVKNGVRKTKTISHDLRTVWSLALGNDAKGQKACKAMEARLIAYKALRAEMNAALDSILADTEHMMDQAGTLDANMALIPFFNYGNENVARIIGDRHGATKAKAATNNAASNAAALFASAAPVSRLIARSK